MTIERASLAEPLRIRGVTVPNRIVMSPMTRGYSPDGVPTDDVVRYYERRALGGCGMLITEAVGIDHPSSLGDAGLGEDQLPFMYSGPSLAGWKRVVDAVHAAGALFLPQLWHQGAMRIPGTGPHPTAPTIGPSGIWGPPGVNSLKAEKIPVDLNLGPEMSDDEIADVIASYIRAAEAANSVGFDGIALHGGHGYLLDNFLWEGTNQRQDRWGGSRTRRTAAVVEILKGIRAVIGEAKPIVFRFSQWKQQDFRAQLADTPDELAEVLGPMADAGVDVFDASVRYFDRAAFEGSELGLAGWAKKLTGKFSMTVGGVGMNKGTFDSAENLKAVDNLELVLKRFERGEFDLVAVGRAVIGDPDWANKALRGELPEPFHPGMLDRLY